MLQSTEHPDTGPQGIIIAAGKSQRMGKKKQLLNIGGHSFLFTIIQKMLSVCDDIIVVLGFDAGYIREKIQLEIEDFCRLDKSAHFSIKYTLNESYERGMFTSLLAGLQDCKEGCDALYHFVDQPDIPLSFYTDFIDQMDETIDWLQPLFKDQKGHPILFSKRLKNALLNFDPDSTLKIFYKEYRPQTKYWPCKYPQTVKDIDTPEEYQRMRNS